jgi:hypothetical protein
MTTVAKCFFSLGIALCSTSVYAAVEMKIVTTTGFVAFTVGDNWSVQSMQSRMPIAAGVFQIPNSADNGTKDSTNLIVMLFQADSDKAREKFESPIKQYGAVAPESVPFDEWIIYRQVAKQGDTIYSILDAKRKAVADVSVSVRLAWPHLGPNSDAYGVEMESLFRAFLKSVRGGVGTYVPRDGEVIRRPVK